MTLSAGTRLGPYEILSPLGAGGMGEVYKARDTRLGRDVAVKVLSASVASDAEHLRRFEQESRSASALSDSHIVTVFDVGVENGIHYFASELVEGGDLRAKLGPGGLPIARAIGIAEQIALGLASAHAKGITHRDLKPENILLTKSGEAKIADFGLAKLSEAPGEEFSRMPTANRIETTAGVVMGTVSYMSPEQAGGRKIDVRSDQFAFGAILYEMLTGTVAFRKETQGETLAAILRDEPAPIAELNPSVPSPLCWIVERCLSKDSEERYASTRDLARDISNVRRRLSAISGAGGAAPVREVPTRSRERIAWSVAAAGLLVALAAVLAARRPPPVSFPGVRFTIPPPKDAGFTGTLALSPDGRKLAFVASGADGHSALWVRPLDSLDARRLEGTQDAAFPFWSPDGRSIGFFAGGKLQKVDSSGGPPQSLCEALETRGGAWSPRGTIIFSANSGGELDRISDSGGQPIALSHLSSRKGESFRWPFFLPDGEHFLYFVLTDDPKQAGIHVGSIESTETAFITASDSGAVYASEGFLIFPRGMTLVKQRFEPRTLRIRGDALPIAENVRLDTIATGAATFAASAGEIAYVAGGLVATDLLWYDRSGRPLGRVGTSGGYIEPALSPDGRWLAVTHFDPRGSTPGIWLFDLERGSFIPISSALSATSLWSSDGRRLVYSKYPSGGVFVRDAHGTQRERLLVATRTFGPLDDWSRDGRLLLWDSIDWRTYHFGIVVHDLTTGQERPFVETRFNQNGGRFSPDGKWIAYESNESGANEIFVRSFPASDERWQVSVGGGDTPRWRGDGRELYYVSADRKVMAVDIRTEPKFEAGVPHALFSSRMIPNIEARNNYDVTADGQRFVVNSRRPEDFLIPITVIVGGSKK